MAWEEKAVLALTYRRLARRPHTVFQIREILQKREIPEELQNTVIRKLIEMKLLNDFEFACAFVRTRNMLKPRPKRVLRLELQRKGISKDDIEQALSEVPVDEEQAVKEIVERQQWKWRNVEGSVRHQKQIEFLMRRGFSYEVIKKVVG